MSVKTISEIQQIINGNAEKKLKSKIEKISYILRNGDGFNLLKDISVNVGTLENPKTIPLPYLLTSSGFLNKVIENNIEEYIENEAKEFVEKVNSIREDVDFLLSNQKYE